MSTNQSDSIQRPAFKAQTVNDLRELLAQARKMVDDLPGSGARAQTLLFQLDAIQDLFARLKDSGADLRAETTRMESIESALRSKDFILLRQLEAAGGLAACRAAANPTPEQWWWFLDEGLAQKEKSQKRQTLRTLGIVAAVLLIAVALYRFVLAPDTSTTRVMDKTSQAEAALKEGDLAGATLAYRQAAELQPDNPELQAWVGVLEEMQGNTEASAEAYANAERLAGSPAHYYVLRGTARSGAGVLDLAIADAQAALAIEPDSAEAYLLLGGVYETQGEDRQAMQALQKAAELAEAGGNSALAATIKIRLGMLGQRPQIPTISVTASPAATK
jgi:tetratricopeptide (TPR) repeat protein